MTKLRFKLILTALLSASLLCGCSELDTIKNDVVEQLSLQPSSDKGSQSIEEPDNTDEAGDAGTVTDNSASSENNSQDNTVEEPVTSNPQAETKEEKTPDVQSETLPSITPSTEQKIEPSAAEEEKKEPEITSTGFTVEHVGVTGITLDKYSTTICVGLSDMPWVTMLPASAPDKSEIWSSSDTTVATVDPYGRIMGIKEGTCTVTVKSADNPEVSADVSVKVIANTDVTTVTKINGIIVANKTYRLPSTYNPGVDPDAQAALDKMFAAAEADGITLFVNSGFRSYELQTTIYNNYVSRDGKDAADRYSARPGYSEHQTGLAFDLNSFEQTFDETPEGIWLAEHCSEYGFIIRFGKDKEEITGYMYEPWHVRYVGTTVAKALTESGQCLEEYLGITSVYAGDN